MALFVTLAVRWGVDQQPRTIRSDAMGYYGYLHAIFIGHDLGREPHHGEYVKRTPTGTLNKYFAGEPVMLLPFFLAAHAYVKATGIPADPYGHPYSDLIHVAGLVYALLGLLALRALLQRLGVRDGTISMVVLVLGFGTQLAQYTALQPGWTHVYSFCCFAAFLLLTLQLAQGARVRGYIAWGALLGLIVLLRPVNGSVLLAVPVVLGEGTRAFLLRPLKHPMVVVLTVAVGLAVVSIQALLWYAQIGSFVAYGYQGEGFHWSRPEVYQVLFGIRRGLFIWTPVMVMAALSVVALRRWDRSRAGAAALYWTVNVYVISSWWIWYYGSGFGHRAFIEHYVVFIIPLALMLDRWNAWKLRAAQAFLALASCFTFAQFFQYNHGLLHDESMDRRKYAYSFLRFDDAHRGRLGGNYQCPPFNPNGMDTLLHEHWNGTDSAPHWSGRTQDPGDAAHGQVMVCRPSDEFGPMFQLRNEELPKGRALYLAIGLERHVQHVDDTRTALVIATVEGPDGSLRYYGSAAMEPLPPAHDGTWEHIEYRIPLPPLEADEHIKFYFWNQRFQASFDMDDLDMTVLAAKPY